jgi:hypothetical protein
MPGGEDAPRGLSLLEGALRGDGAPPRLARIRRLPDQALPPRAPAAAPAAAEPTPAAAAALSYYPDGSFRVVCEDDGRRRPASRRALRLYAPASPATIPLRPASAAAAAAAAVRRHDVPGVRGAFSLTGVLSSAEAAAMRGAAEAVGFRVDDPTAADAGEAGGGSASPPEP